MLLLTLAVLQGAYAYPWVSRAAGVDSSILQRGSIAARDSADCPFNANHEPAAPVTADFPYNNAKDGKPGNGKGGYLVPAPGDTAHEFRMPDPKTDIRGPCPGLNTAANHGFLARDGIVTYNELDGDIVGTSKLSIGCDASSRTALTGNLLAEELGLNGHNHFEADTSLTRNDYFLADGDNYRWNATLFTHMMDYCQGNCDLQALAKCREARYYESRAENGNFFFGPGSLLLYGAASFLYELFPTAGGTADEVTMMSFFGANKTSDGQYVWNGGERIPPNWRARVDPYTNFKVGREIFAMYLLHPVAFGGNIGQNNFLGMNFSTYIQNGQLNLNTPYDAMCLLYQTLTGPFPAELGNVINLPVAVENAITAKILRMAQNFGCPINPNSGDGVSGTQTPQ
ncbi:hypothetical protein PRZ48_011428 [Zasmidium cellare]|uniref:Heme haloperoxidase family profile domain-containing protein n=1 Tax=Zasmidium cellare TaxID=395010 RepID=A0ABR0E6N1_ZASCE|nr:hypothetical protein PRZ48_011428 [Zasmidium cellare]